MTTENHMAISEVGGDGEAPFCNRALIDALGCRETPLIVMLSDHFAGKDVFGTYHALIGDC